MDYEYDAQAFRDAANNPRAQGMFEVVANRYKFAAVSDGLDVKELEEALKRNGGTASAEHTQRAVNEAKRP